MRRRVWYYAETGGKAEGPLHGDELLELVQDGTIHADTLVWHGGMEEWKPLGEVKDLHPPRPSQRANPRRYSTGSKRSFVVQVLMLSVAAVHVLMALLYFELLGMLDDAAAGRMISERRGQEFVEREEVLLAVYGLCVLLAGVTFLAWFHRAYANLRAFHSGPLRYSPGWALGGWFVPFLNIVRPYQVAMEIWKVSHAPNERVGQATDYTVLVWWLLLGGSGVVTVLADRMSTKVETLEQARAMTWLEITSSVMVLGAAIAAILMIRGVQRAQAAAVAAS